MTEQRRLAAILVADVVGYSKLIGSDEAGTLAQLQALRTEVIEPQIAKHAGRLFKSVGDGFLVEFASAVQAVSCAKAIQDANGQGRLGLRIGIHVGDVVVHGDDLMGDGVNVAARVEAIPEPGGIAVTRSVHEQVRDKLDLGFVDKGEIELKNIQRPVQVFVIEVAKVDRPPVALPMPERPSIAVLPFQNMSGDPEQEYFVDGLVEDIITALSRFKSLFVVARNSSFTYKGRSVDIKQVGRELGVRYVLEGSVRKAGGRVRITGQLIEASTGHHLWADKFDGALEAVFDLQDKVTSSVVGAVAPAMQAAEIERSKRKPTNDLDAYDLFLRGSAAVWEGRANEAIGFFRKAIAIDDRYAEAYGLCAGTYVVLQTYRGTAIDAEERAEALRFADIAANLATDEALSLARAAQALVFFGKEYDRGLAMIERSVSLNPNSSSVWLIRGWINFMASEIEEARSSFLRVLQFTELDPARIGACCGMAWCCFHLGKYDEGCAWAAKALQKYSNALYLVPMIMNAVRAGRMNDARSSADQLLRIIPSFQKAAVIVNRKVEFETNVAKALSEAGVA